MANTKKIFQLATILMLALAACNLPTEPPPTPNLPVTFTLLALTRTAMALTPPSATVTSTTTLTPIPTFTPSPTVTPLCDVAAFVQDVTLPDNSTLKPGEQQNKIWRIKNIGSCTWTTEYAIVFDHGDKLSPNDLYLLPGNVPPGEVVDIVLPITAPSNRGFYQSNWVLRNPQGQKFGLQRAGNDPTFWVKIKVTDAFYDFVENACQAEWASSGAGNNIKLACPGKNTDPQGFIIPFSNKLRAEDNQEYSYGLLTAPYASDNGFVSGTYPFINIGSGYSFKTRIGCSYKSGNSNCNIHFQINYRLVPGESPRNLIETDQIFDGQLQDLNIDLSTLAGQNVQFILTVITNGIFPNDNIAFWVEPRLGPP